MELISSNMCQHLQRPLSACTADTGHQPKNTLTEATGKSWAPCSSCYLLTLLLCISCPSPPSIPNFSWQGWRSKNCVRLRRLCLDAISSKKNLPRQWQPSTWFCVIFIFDCFVNILADWSQTLISQLTVFPLNSDKTVCLTGHEIRSLPLNYSIQSQYFHYRTDFSQAQVGVGIYLATMLVIGSSPLGLKRDAL